MVNIFDLILEYKVSIALSIAVILFLLVSRSEMLQGQLKKIVTFLLVLAGLGVGYYLFTGDSPSHIPGNIKRFFGDPQLQDEATHRYYKDPDERYGEQLEQQE